MTKKFDDFKAALEALCREHKIRIDCGEYNTYAADLDDEDIADFQISEWMLGDSTAPTPEEHAAAEIRRAVESEKYAKERAEWAVRQAADRAAQEKRDAERLASPEYEALQDKVRALADQSRKEQMRISTDPTDPAFIDARPRRVWINNVEVLNWIVADEFRRCVIAPGKEKGDTVVMHGAVLIERLGEPGAPVVEAPAEASTSLAGMFIPVPKAAAEVVEAPAPTFAAQTVPIKAVAMTAKPAKKSKKVR